jgi:hypothetical protein
MLKLLRRQLYGLSAAPYLLVTAATLSLAAFAQAQPPVVSVPVSGGWNAISLPYQPVNADPYEIFDELRPPTQTLDLLTGSLHRYENAISSYVTYTTQAPSPFGPARPGVGYLLWTPVATTVKYECSLPTSVPQVALPGHGWHIIGLPRLGSFTLADVCVTDTDLGQSMLFPDAVAAGWIHHTVYRIDRADSEGRGMTYTMLPAVGQDWTTASLNAYAAYWVNQSRDNIILSFDRPPSNLAAQAMAPTQVRLTWTDVTVYDTGYQVERRTPTTEFQRIATLPLDAALYNDYTVSPNTTYQYRVRGLNAVGFTSYTATVSVTTPEATGSVPLGYVTAVAADANRLGYAYGASRELGLIVFDVSDPTAPQVVATAAPPTSGVVMGMHVSGNLAAVAARDAVSIYDLSTPSAPVRVSALAVCAQDAAIVGNYLYVSDAYNDLAVYNISTPASPVPVTTTPVRGYQLDLADGNLWIGALSELRGISLRTPSAPSLLGAYVTTPCQVVSGGNGHVYTYSGAALRVVDVSNPRDPFEVGFTMVEGGTLSGLCDLDGYVYATFRSSLVSNSLYVYDVLDPNQPTLVGGARTQGAPTAAVAVRVSPEDRRVYVADGIAGLSVFDVTDPAHPQLIGSCSST